jgi:argininosuccinate synthase
MQRIVLAYSGGVRSSTAISWLAETLGAEVVALTLDIGQGGDLEAVRDRALTLGAIRAHVLDVRDEFARHYVVPALKADALYDDRRSRANVLSRPLIAQKLVEIAAIEQTAAVGHGARPGDPQISLAVRALSQAIDVIVLAPDVPVLALMQTGVFDRLAVAAKSPGECPDEPAFVEITFTGGAPAAINGIVMPLVDLAGSLDIIAGAHGVGRSDALESPAAIVLHAAHKDLQTLTMTRQADAFSRSVSQQFADIIEQGSWFTPLREALEAYVDTIQDSVSGVVRLELFKGGCAIVDRRASPADAGVATPVHKLTFAATAKA